MKGQKIKQKHIFLSSNKSSTVLKTLRQEGCEVPTPAQSVIWRGVLRKAEKIKVK